MSSARDALSLYGGSNDRSLYYQLTDEALPAAGREDPSTFFWRELAARAAHTPIVMTLDEAPYLHIADPEFYAQWRRLHDQGAPVSLVFASFVEDIRADIAERRRHNLERGSYSPSLNVCQTVGLPPLEGSEVGRLLADDLFGDPDVAAAFTPHFAQYARFVTGGNPFLTSAFGELISRYWDEQGPGMAEGLAVPGNFRTFAGNYASALWFLFGSYFTTIQEPYVTRLDIQESSRDEGTGITIWDFFLRVLERQTGASLPHYEYAMETWHERKRTELGEQMFDKAADTTWVRQNPEPRAPRFSLRRTFDPSIVKSSRFLLGLGVPAGSHDVAHLMLDQFVASGFFAAGADARGREWMSIRHPGPLMWLAQRFGWNKMTVLNRAYALHETLGLG